MMKLIFLLLIIHINILYAEYISITSNANNCKEATNNALRNAVEAVVGAKIQTRTEINNGKLQSDKIFSSTDGLVKNYEQISENIEDGYCEVTLRVNVLENKIEEKIDDFIKSKSSMRMFNKTNFKDKTVMVFYTTRGMPGALESYSEAAQSILLNIKKQLNKYQFDVRVKEQVGMSKNIDISKLLEMSRISNADVILQVSLVSLVSRTADGYVKSYVRALIDMYDSTTGKFISSIEGKGRSFGKNSTMGIIMAQMSASEKASKDAMPKLVKQIISNLSVGSKQVIQVVIKNIPSRIQRKLRKALKNSDLEFKVAIRERDYVMLEFDTVDNLTDFEDKILDLWDDKKLRGELDTIHSQGSKIIFEYIK